MYRVLTWFPSLQNVTLSKSSVRFPDVETITTFLRSPSVIAYLWCLALSATLSVGAAYHLYQSNLTLIEAFPTQGPITSFLEFNTRQSLAVGVSLFLIVAGLGIAFLRHHFNCLELRSTADDELAENNRRFRAALDNMGDGLCMFDENNGLAVYNDRYAKWYNLPDELLAIGTPNTEIIAHRVAQGILNDIGADRSSDDSIDISSQFEVDKPSNRIDQLKDGRIISVNRQPLVGGGFVATHKDISEQYQSDAKIAHMAHHDTLTDLPNRVLFQKRLSEGLDRVKRGEMIAVHCLDLDHFKNVNDTLGHPSGDKLLTIVSERLKREVREVDTIARLGGDEFAIVQSLMEAPQDATSLANRIVDTLNEPFELDGNQVIIGVSIGIALAPNDGQSVEELMKNADLALYRVKSEGRGAYCFFEQTMDDKMQERRLLELDLRKALDCDEFELHYQPLVNLQTSHVCGFEALVRWQHPERGLVSPGEFIPMLEEIGLVATLGSWVLQRACTDASHWPEHIKIAVNLSALQFKDGFLAQNVEDVLKATGLPAHRLELEVTESMLIENTEATVEILHQLRSLGVRISMDDFGTGYSSLSYLQSFPFDKIKIDRSFIKDLSDQDDALAIVRAVTALSSNLGMTTTAEGVETKEQLEIIRSEGCTEVQGFYFSSARPADEISELIATLSPSIQRTEEAA